MNPISLETSRKQRKMLKGVFFQQAQVKEYKTIALAALGTLAVIMIFANMVKLTNQVSVLELRNDKLVKKLALTQYSLSTTENSLSETQDELEKVSSEAKSNIEALNKTVSTLNKEVVQLKSDNKQLASEYDEVYDKYKVLYQRKELYDKYEYIIEYAGKRTDVTYDQIKLGEELMAENGYDPNILFGIMSVESRGDVDAKNSSSTATGYGQFLAGTGKYVYENLLGYGNGTYIHSVNATNGNTSIKMMAAYIQYLMQLHNGNMFAAVKNYCGRSTAGTYQYISAINSFTSKVGVNALALVSAH